MPRFAPLFLLLAATAGCGSPSAGQAGSPGAGMPTDSVAENPPPIVATLTLPNGNIVNFYDAVSGAFVTEQAGFPGAIPAFNFPGNAKELASSWRAAAPNVPVPPALLDLEVRLTNPDLPARPAGKWAPEEF